MNEEKKKKKKWPIIAGVIAVIIIIGAAAGGSSEPKKIGDGSGSGTVTEGSTEKSKFAVGDVVELNGVQVTLVEVTESTGVQFFEPDEGNVFLICEFEINNQSSKDINVSSIMSFDAYCDDYSVNTSIMAASAGKESGKTTLDGTVAAGKKMNGIISYEVSSEWKTLEITYSPDYWGNKSMTFEAVK